MQAAKKEDLSPFLLGILQRREKPPSKDERLRAQVRDIRKALRDEDDLADERLAGALRAFISTHGEHDDEG